MPGIGALIPGHRPWLPRQFDLQIELWSVDRPAAEADKNERTNQDGRTINRF